MFHHSLRYLKAKGVFKRELQNTLVSFVFFDKGANKWRAQIMIEGKQRIIGHYENDEEAAIDYARAVFKKKKKKPQLIMLE